MWLDAPRRFFYRQAGSLSHGMTSWKLIPREAYTTGGLYRVEPVFSGCLLCGSAHLFERFAQSATRFSGSGVGRATAA